MLSEVSAFCGRVYSFKVWPLRLHSPQRRTILGHPWLLKPPKLSPAALSVGFVAAVWLYLSLT